MKCPKDANTCPKDADTKNNYGHCFGCGKKNGYVNVDEFGHKHCPECGDSRVMSVANQKVILAKHILIED